MDDGGAEAHNDSRHTLADEPHVSPTGGRQGSEVSRVPGMPGESLRPEDYATMAWALGAIAAMTAIGALILSRFRGVAEKDRIEASETLTKFREMHSQGQLSDEEFRTIKAKLTAELRRELKDSEEPG